MAILLKIMRVECQLMKGSWMEMERINCRIHKDKIAFRAGHMNVAMQGIRIKALITTTTLKAVVTTATTTVRQWLPVTVTQIKHM